MNENLKRELLARMLMSEHPVAQIVMACDAGIMKDIVPEFLALRHDEAGQGRHKDNLLHTATVVAKCPPVERIRMAAFFHDIGKPPTRSFEHGKVTFWGHEEVGARMTRKIMKRLGYQAEYADEVARIVEMSGRVRGAEDWTDSAVRRFVSDAGDVLEDLLVFCFNDTTSKHASTRKVVEDQVNFLRGRIAEVQALDIERAKRPPVNGYQVMERYGIPQGRMLGKYMELLTPEMDEEEAWACLDAARAAGLPD